MTDLRQVFRRVFEENYSLLMKVVYRMTGREDLAEEIVQEAMIKYYENIRQLPHDESARFWLLRVARNLALNHEKRRQRERQLQQNYFHAEAVATQQAADAPLLRSAERDLVQEALMSLPFNLRAVLILKEYFNFSYAEIAESLAITEGNVKVRVHRARLALAAHLKKEVTHG